MSSPASPAAAETVATLLAATNPSPSGATTAAVVPAGSGSATSSVSSASNSEEAPAANTNGVPALAARIWGGVCGAASAIGGVISTITSFVFGIFTTIWSCLSSPFRSGEATPAVVLTPEARIESLVAEISRVDATTAEKLQSFINLLAAPNAEGFEMEAVALSVQLRAGYDALPDAVKSVLNTAFGSEITAETNLREATILTAAESVHGTLSSEMISGLGRQITDASTDRDKLITISQMIGVPLHDLEPEFTEEVKAARVSAAFASLSDDLRNQIEGAIWANTLNPEDDITDSAELGALDAVTITINDTEYVTSNSDFGTQVLTNAPLSEHVQGGLARWIAQNPTAPAASTEDAA